MLNRTCEKYLCFYFMSNLYTCMIEHKQLGQYQNTIIFGITISNGP